MKTNDEKWLETPLAVIKEHAPGVYARMQEADWEVCVVTQDSADELFGPLLAERGPLYVYMMVNDLNNSFGITFPAWNGGAPADIPRASIHQTWLNRPLMEHKAAVELGVPLAEFVASVMVHEFVHRELDMTDTEPEAYAVSTFFAERLGIPALSDYEHESAAHFAYRKGAAA